MLLCALTDKETEARTGSYKVDSVPPPQPMAQDLLTRLYTVFHQSTSFSAPE